MKIKILLGVSFPENIEIRFFAHCESQALLPSSDTGVANI